MSSWWVEDPHDNAWAARYFAIAVGGIMVLFVIRHWTRFVALRYGPRRPAGLARRLVHLSRSASKTLSKPIYHFHVGKSLLHILYWAINLILVLTNLDLSDMSNVAKRLGWLTFANLSLLVFLALRHTPLALLSGNSYEKLRPLHKSAGYTTIVLMALHAIIYLAVWSKQGYLQYMTLNSNIAGAIAGVAMLVIALSTIGWVTRGYYEVFYVIHIVMFLLILITAGMHRPDLSQEALVILIFTAALWSLDRILRAARLLYFSLGNYATITPLPGDEGVVRVKLSRTVPAAPGSHVFLWLPAVRVFETHPFTIASASSSSSAYGSEFVIRAYDGFTKDLHALALKDPGRMLRCSVDGAYGSIPDFRQFDRTILLAGGSGASFTFSVALGLLQGFEAASATAEKTRASGVDFVWVIRSLDSLKWFETELSLLTQSPLVNVSIYVTRDAELSGNPIPVPVPVPTETEASPHASATALPKIPTVSTVPSPSGSTSDIELGVYSKTPVPKVTSDDSLNVEFNVNRGRPDIGALVRGCIAGEDNLKMGIGGCGPGQMIAALKRAVREGEVDGPSVTLYTEEFAW